MRDTFLTVKNVLSTRAHLSLKRMIKSSGERERAEKVQCWECVGGCEKHRGWSGGWGETGATEWDDQAGRHVKNRKRQDWGSLKKNVE